MNPQAHGKLGFWSIVLFGINGVIGSGIFLLPGKAMDLIGPGSVFVYLFVAAVVMTIALCFAECAGRFTRNGAAYVYAREAFGAFVGFEVGILSWAVRIIAWAALAAGFVTALSSLWPPALHEPSRTLIVLAILLGLGSLNLLGVRPMRLVNNLVTVGKLLPLVVFVLVGVWFIAGSRFQPMFPRGLTRDTFGTTGLVIFYAFTGFEGMAVAAEDMDDPRRNLPMALMVVMGLCGTIYFAVQAIAVGTLGPALARSSAPVADAASVFMGSCGKWMVALGALVSIGGINVAASFMAPRTGVALATDRIVPARFAELNRFGVPWVSILATVLVAVPVALSGSFVQLAAISMVSRFAQYLPTCLAVLVLRRRNGLPRGFTIPFGPVIPLTAALACLWLLTKATHAQLLWGLGALAVGVPLFFLMLFLNRNQGSGAVPAATHFPEVHL
ncbi:MAG: APC family permease [Holophaga sp.]|nr:APC family permease [Holophaga sp.]